MLTVYLARHGQTDWNASRRLQGWTDISLNATGRAQASRLRSRLEGVTLDRIYTSTLERSRMTADALSGMAPFEALEDLRERCLGGFEGRFVDGRDPELDAEFRARKYRPGDDLDGGESIEVFRGRVTRAIEHVTQAHQRGTVLIVGHGATNSMILGHFLRLDLQGVANLWIANDDLFRVEPASQGRWRVWHELIEPSRTRGRR